MSGQTNQIRKINESGNCTEDEEEKEGMPNGVKSLEKMLFEAIGRGDAEAVKEAIRQGIELNSVKEGEISPVMCAVMSHKPEMLQLLLNAGANVNMGDNWEALHWAVQLGDIDSARALLEAGINPDTTDAENSCYTPLTRAAKACSIYGTVLLETLVRHGCSVNKPGIMGNTALHVILEEGLYDVVPFLLEFGADPSLENDFRRSCLEVVVSSMPHADIETVAAILEACSSKWTSEEVKHYHLNGALYVAVKNRRTDLVSFLLEHGASPDCSLFGPPRVENVLQLACSTGDDVEMVRLLVNAGVPLNERDRKLAYPIHAAVEHRRLRTLKMFLDFGANPNVRRFKGLETPLLLAIKREYDEGALVLVQSNCDANQPGYDRLSPLYSDGETVQPVEFALNRHRWFVVQALVAAGCHRQAVRSWLKRVIEEGYVHYGEEAIKEVKRLVNVPMSLKDQSRIFFRNLLGLGLLNGVQRLPIPGVLRNFILMNEYITVEY